MLILSSKSWISISKFYSEFTDYQLFTDYAPANINYQYTV